MVKVMLYVLVVATTLVVHSNARPMPATAGDVADQKTFLPCIPRVPGAVSGVDAKNQQRTFDLTPAESPAGAVGDNKNFIYGGGIGGFAGVGGYAGVVGGFPVLGGIHYGGIGGAGGVAGGAGGLLPCP